MSYFEGPPDYLVSLAVVLGVGLVATLVSLALGFSRPPAQRPALLPVALALGFAAPLLALPLAFGPLMEALAYLDQSRAGAQATLMTSARLLLAGGVGLLATLVAFAVGIAPALGASAGGSAGRSSRPALALALAVSVVALGVFEYSRSGLNLTRYVLTTLAEGSDPAELEEARGRHALLRDQASIAELADAMTRAASVGQYGGGLAFLLVVALGAAGFVLGRGVEAGRGLAQGGLLLALALAAVTVFWMSRLSADSAAIEERHFGSRASVAEPVS
jgi:hypothetical protein